MFNNARKWEHTRKISHTIAAVNSTKQIDILEFMPLLTDPPKEETKKITPEDLAEMKKKASERMMALKSAGKM